MSKHIKIGIVGSGYAAHFHLASYQKIYGHSFELLALCGRNVDAVKTLADQFSVKRRYTNIDNLLNDHEIDLVDICVPNYLHADLVMQCAKHGKHLICEKPLTGFFGPQGAADDWSAKGFPRMEMLETVMAQGRRIRTELQKSGTILCYA